MKKGFVFPSINLMLAAVVGILFIIIVAKVIIIMNSGDDIEKCKASVLVSHQANMIPDVTKQRIVNIDCNSNDLVLGKDYFKDNSVLTNKILVDVGKEIKNCWYKMGEGKLQPFHESFFVDKTICVVCSNILPDPFFTRVASNNQQPMGWEYFTKLRVGSMTLEEYVSQIDGDFLVLADDISAQAGDTGFFNDEMIANFNGGLTTIGNYVPYKQYVVLFVLLTNKGFRDDLFLDDSSRIEGVMFVPIDQISKVGCEVLFG